MYSKNASGNSHRFMLIGNAGANLSSGSPISMSDESLGIEGVNLTVANTGADVLSDRLSIFAKDSRGQFYARAFEFGKMNATSQITIIDDATVGTKTTINLSDIGTGVKGMDYFLTLNDTTEGTEPTHIETYNCTADGTTDVIDLIKADFDEKLLRFNTQGLGWDVRYNITTTGTSLEVTPLSAKTETVFSLREEVGNIAGVAEWDVLNYGTIHKVSPALDEIWISDALQLWKESNQYSGGFNESGFDRDVNIGDGGDKLKIGQVITSVSAFDTDFSKSRPKTVAGIEVTVLMVTGATAANNMKPLLGL